MNLFTDWKDKTDHFTHTLDIAERGVAYVLVTSLSFCFAIQLFIYLGW